MALSSNVLTDKEFKILHRDYLRMMLPSVILFLVLFFANLIYCSINKTFGTVFFLFLLLSIFLSWILFYLITQAHQLDLKQKNVSKEKEIVREKVYKKDYEAGSASISINKEMREMHIYYVVVKAEKIYIDKNQYDEVEIGDTIYIRRAKNTKLFLGIEIEKCN